MLSVSHFLFSRTPVKINEGSLQGFWVAKIGNFKKYCIKSIFDRINLTEEGRLHDHKFRISLHSTSDM